ncbi:hypothetical protein GE21DRAFT_1223741, partial [Neurospora crassa]
FFYPSTEWTMAQPFDCLCAKPTCRGRISGARDMTDAQLAGAWLNGHIRDLLEEQRGCPTSTSSSIPSATTANASTTTTTTTTASSSSSSSSSSLNGSNSNSNSNGNSSSNFPSATYTIPEKKSSSEKTNGYNKVGELDQIAQSLRDALTHAEKVVEAARNALMSYVGAVNDAATAAANNGAAKKKEEEEEESPEGARRRGPTSRELSGEMGGDTMEVLA